MNRSKKTSVQNARRSVAWWVVVLVIGMASFPPSVSVATVTPPTCMVFYREWHGQAQLLLQDVPDGATLDVQRERARNSVRTTALSLVVAPDMPIVTIPDHHLGDRYYVSIISHDPFLPCTIRQRGPLFTSAYPWYMPMVMGA